MAKKLGGLGRPKKHKHFHNGRSLQTSIFLEDLKKNLKNLNINQKEWKLIPITGFQTSGW